MISKILIYSKVTDKLKRLDTKEKGEGKNHNCFNELLVSWHSKIE